MIRGKRAVLFALTAVTAIFLLTEVAIAHKAITDDDDMVITDDSTAQQTSESGEVNLSGSDGQA